MELSEVFFNQFIKDIESGTLKVPRPSIWFLKDEKVRFSMFGWPDPSERRPTLDAATAVIKRIRPDAYIVLVEGWASRFHDADDPAKLEEYRRNYKYGDAGKDPNRTTVLTLLLKNVRTGDVRHAAYEEYPDKVFRPMPEAEGRFESAFSALDEARSTMHYDKALRYLRLIEFSAIKIER